MTLRCAAGPMTWEAAEIRPWAGRVGRGSWVALGQRADRDGDIVVRHAAARISLFGRQEDVGFGPVHLHVATGDRRAEQPPYECAMGALHADRSARRKTTSEMTSVNTPPTPNMTTGPNWRSLNMPATNSRLPRIWG